MCLSKSSNDKIKVYTIYKIMLSYYLKCRKNTESKSPKVENMENNVFIQICCVS